MSAREKDEHDEASEKRLPCITPQNYACSVDLSISAHHQGCPAYYRPAVAADRRAQAAAHKAEVERLTEQFQAETLRTSDLTAMLRRCENLLCEIHTPGPWSRDCARCELVKQIHSLLETPLNTEFTALRERLAQAEKERNIITVNPQRKVLFTGVDIQRAAHIAGLEAARDELDALPMVAEVSLCIAAIDALIEKERGEG